MRLTHEAVRQGFRDLLASIPSTSENMEEITVLKMQVEIDSLNRCIALHGRSENNKFFPMLDEKFDNVCTKAGFVGEHEKDEKERIRMSAAYASIKGCFYDKKKGKEHGNVESFSLSLSLF